MKNIKEELYINNLKKAYIYEKEDTGETFVISKRNCFKVTKEVAYLIDYLPKKKSKKEYLEVLKELDIDDTEKIFGKLIEISIINKKEEKDFCRKLKEILKKTFNPNIKVIPCNIQEWFMELLKRLKVISESRKNSKKLLYLITSFLFFISISGLFLNNYLLNNRTVLNNNNFTMFTIFGLFFLGIMSHELGHSFMCEYCKIGVRPIGFTIILIYPVFYTNVSGIDELRLKDRLLINMSGLALQGCYMVILFIIFMITRYSVLVLVLKMLFDMFFFNFHPLIRTDGYWTFKDILFFVKDKKIGKVINKIYYILYIVFSLYLGYRAYSMIVSSIKYFVNFREIEFNIMLFMKLFYVYLVIILVKGIRRRLKDAFENLFSKEKKIENKGKVISSKNI